MAGSSDANLNIDITAKDEASKVLDPLQKKVDKLEKTETEVAVTADDKATKTLDGVQKKADDLNKEDVTVDVTADVKGASDVDSFATKLSKLSDSDQIVTLALRAGSVQSELSGLIQDVAQLDAEDPTIDIKIDRINDLTGELDELKGKMKSIAETSIDPDVHDFAKKKLGDIAEASGKAGDAVHSMAGNAIGDFATTASGVQPLGEAIGQLTEGVLGGEIAMQDLAKAGLGLGAIAAGTIVLNQVMKEFAESAARVAAIKAFKDDEVKAFAKGVKEGSSATDILNKRLQDTNELVSVVGTSLKGLSFSFKSDISEVMARNGISVQLFGKAVEGGESSIAAFQAAMEASKVPTQDVTTLIDAARTEYEAYAKGQEIAARTAALSSNASIEVAKSAALSAEARRLDAQAAQYQAEQVTAAALAQSQAAAAAAAGLEANAAATTVAANQAQAYQDRIDGVNAKIQEQIDKLKADADALNAVSNAYGTAADDQISYNKALGDFGTKAKDAKASADDIRDSAIGAAKAHAALYVSLTEASGAAATATGKLDAQNETLIATARLASGPAKAAIEDYIFSLNGIPPDKRTDIVATLNKGDVVEAKRLIDEASANRTATIRADADTSEAQRDTDAFIKNNNGRSFGIKIIPSIVPFRVQASGGVTPPRGGIAGEAGAEFIQMPGQSTVLIDQPTYVPPGTRVTSVRKTRQLLRGRRPPRFYANGTSQPAPVVNVAAPVLPPIVVKLDGRPIAALIGSTTAPAVRAAAMTIRAGRA